MSFDKNSFYLMPYFYYNHDNKQSNISYRE